MIFASFTEEQQCKIVSRKRYVKQEFSQTVLCHQLWLKTKADEIPKDKNYDRDKNSWLTGSLFADPDHF